MKQSILQLIWASTTPGDLAVIVLLLIAAPAILYVAYAKTKRWDRLWKEGWERRHSSPLTSLRRKKQQALKAVTIVRWAAQAVFFMSIGFALWPVTASINDLGTERASLIILFIAFSVLTLFGVAIFVGGTMLLKYQLARIDELLSAETKVTS